ncbi:helix-turn-helix domain-containing protein [Fodinicurvata halophila]|uniref:Helix-turn-helix domain-containing protein n=1 Tax=Fodinicurvata halophila TaxID=1419723 RepID=A0ABV8UMB4_9PROT
MTPFGAKLRRLREQRSLSLKDMAVALEVSPAYLSALEHGHRGKPSLHLIHAVCQYLGIIWDEAEELERLAELSHPRVVIDTSGLTPEATELANRLAETVTTLSQERLATLLAVLREDETTETLRQKVSDQDSS